ncbi:TPA: phage tail protein, partial [Citrobacter freundii]|nr:phage tail protein [Citrobacter freundii]
MSTTPTNQPVPSEKPQDLKFNAGKIDEFVTSMARQYIDRFGHAHYTIEGLRWVAQQAISQFGYITLDSFEDGNSLTLPNQVLRLEATGEYYRWDGAFPKEVPASSTPESTGGIGVGKWLSVGDAAFRQEANKKFKFSVKLSDYLTLQDAASAAVDGLLIDREYNFTDNETVDFGGKVLTIICKESFVADGSLVFT